jgi:methylated-DNA-protein-cysteine methyltransferase-like protein
MPKHAIYYVIARVPHSRVATYGQIAELAGLGRGARQVGRTLKNLPFDSGLPWHRIVNSRGAISLPPTSASFGVQKEKLQQEGIIFKNDRIDLKLYGWNPGSDL